MAFFYFYILLLRRKSEPVTKRVVICDATNERKRHVQFIYIMKRVKSSFFVAIQICVQYATVEYCKTSSVFDGDILKNERREGNI